MFYIFSYVFFSSEKTNAFSFLQARKKSRNGQTTTADESSLSPRQHFSANPLFLLLAPHIRNAMVNVCEIERPRDIPGHDTVDNCRGQHPQPHGLGHGSFVLTDGLGQLADVSELALVDILLPAERPRQAERERYGFIGDGAGARKSSKPSSPASSGRRPTARRRNRPSTVPSSARSTRRSIPAS